MEDQVYGVALMIQNIHYEFYTILLLN